MSLAQQILDVYSLTNRSDLVAETTLAVKQATLKVHHIDFFPRDLAPEVSFATAAPATVNTVDYTSLLGARFRALSYMRVLDYSSGLNIGPYFDIISADNALDSYGLDKVNAVYLAGTFWKIRTEENQQFFTIGYYQSPDVTDAGYSSWVDSLVPQAITYEAARIVFKIIGHDAMADKMDSLTQEAFVEVRAQGTQLHGY